MIGHNPRSAQVRAEVEILIANAEEQGPDAVFELADEIENKAFFVAEHLAALDYLLTGTACYGLTMADRLDRVRALVDAAQKGVT